MTTRSPAFLAPIPLAATGLGLLVAALLAAELMFGGWFSTAPLSRLALPHDLEMLVPAAGLYEGAEDFVYRRDHWGFRGPGLDPRGVTILTLGGGATDQPTLPDDKTWQAVLARALAEQGTAAVVANAGVDGQTTAGHVRALEEWLPNVPDLQPRFVLAYVGIEDVDFPADTRADRLEHGGRWERIRHDSALLRWATTLVTPRRDRPRAVDLDHAPWTDIPNRPQETRDTGPYRERLKRMAHLIHGMGAVPVLVTQARGDSRIENGRRVGLAAPAGLNGLDRHRLLARFNAATLEVCRDQGLLCLDLAQEVAFGRGDFHDPVHATPQGAEKVGRWLAGKLAGLV